MLGEGVSFLPLLLFLLFDCLLLVLFSVASRGEHACPNFKPDYCSEYSEFNISYPFWKLSDDPQINNSHCGYQGFGVTCEPPDFTPILLLQNYSYRVLNISYTPPVIYLAYYDFMPSDMSCPRVRHNVTWFSDVPLSYTNNDANLTFLFDCNNGGSENNSISCLPTGKNYVLVGNQTPYGPQNCHEIFVSPVLQSHLNDTPELGNHFAQLLEYGFELNWSSDTNGFCANCERSGGQCGQNNANNDPVPACFHSNGTIEEYQITCFPP